MPDVQLDPHEFRHTGRPRLWGKANVIKFALLALAIVIGASWILLTAEDANPAMFGVIALMTWPWVLIIGAAIGHLVPSFYFSDDDKKR